MSSRTGIYSEFSSGTTATHSGPMSSESDNPIIDDDPFGIDILSDKDVISDHDRTDDDYDYNKVFEEFEFGEGEDGAARPDEELGLGTYIDPITGEIQDEKTMQSEGESSAKETRHVDSVVFNLEHDLEETMEESTTSEAAISPDLCRLPYFQRFMDAMTDYGTVKRLNNFLHKKMADYFKKRKMDHVLIEVEHPEESLAKYGRKLDSFACLKHLDEKQRREITEELTEMKETKNRQCKEAAENFQRMLEREAEIGIGLISVKTGKEIPEKYVEKLINNQRSKAKELQQLRLTHIKIRNAVAEKNAAIRALDRIGEKYTLIEFEQLKIENQGHIDKIEERDDELTRLRKKCQGAIQCLAHVREKCSASEQNIRVMRETLIDRDTEKTLVREEMNRLKQERDHYRLETQRLKEENGLLTKDKLLIDMENAMNAIVELETLNKEKRESLATEKVKLKNLKKHYDRELRRRAMAEKNKRDLGPKKSFLSARRLRQSRNKYMSDRASFLFPQLEKKRKYT